MHSAAAKLTALTTLEHLEAQAREHQHGPARLSCVLAVGLTGASLPAYAIRAPDDGGTWHTLTEHGPRCDPAALPELLRGLYAAGVRDVRIFWRPDHAGAR